MLRVSHLHTWCVCVDSVELATCKASLHILVCTRHIWHLHPFILETISVRLMGQVMRGKVIRVAEQYLVWKYNQRAPNNCVLIFDRHLPVFAKIDWNPSLRLILGATDVIEIIKHGI